MTKRFEIEVCFVILNLFWNRDYKTHFYSRKIVMAGLVRNRVYEIVTNITELLRKPHHRFIDPVAACAAMTILVEFNFVENKKRYFVPDVCVAAYGVFYSPSSQRKVLVIPATSGPKKCERIFWVIQPGYIQSRRESPDPAFRRDDAERAG